MKRVAIDFASKRMPAPGVGVALFLIGAIVCAVGLWRHGVADVAKHQAMADLKRAQAFTAARQPKRQQEVVRLSEAEIGAINLAITRLNLPWQPLFQSLEAAKPKTVAILGLEPDGAKRLLNIQAEAKTPEDMVDFVEAVRTQPTIAGATLLRHEVNELDPNRPYRFQVEARWKEQL